MSVIIFKIQGHLTLLTSVGISSHHHRAIFRNENTLLYALHNSQNTLQEICAAKKLNDANQYCLASYTDLYIN